MPSVHAKLGPSSAHRWLNCTPSAELESHFPNKSSSYAEEGTLAHSIVEERLQRIIKGKPRGTTSARLKKKEFYAPEMEDYVDEYVTFVTEIYDELEKQGKHPAMYSETKVDFSEWVPDGFGTTDTAITADDVLYIFDFKYGRGVRVDAKDNPQLKLYALGAYNEFSMIWDFSRIEMYIVQPRIVDGIVHDSIEVNALLDWAENEVKPKAQMASAGEGACVEGDWCKFCRAKTVCKARAAKYLEFLKETERNPKTLEPEDLAKLLPLAKYIAGWAEELKEYMFDQAINRAVEYPGYKLVAGRSDRVIVSPKLLAERLTAAGFNDIYELKGITALEKMVGVQKFADIAGNLIDKPAGKPTLVAESDPRPAIGSTMFDDEEGVKTDA